MITIALQRRKHVRHSGLDGGGMTSRNRQVNLWSSATKAGKQKVGRRFIKSQAQRKTFPEGQPRKPLTAYNLFFKYERARILPLLLEGKLLKNHPRKHLSAKDIQNFLEDNPILNKTVPRVHRKSHGMIPFTDLAKHVSTSWNNLESKTKLAFKQVADKRKREYWRQMAENMRQDHLKSISGESAHLLTSEHGRKSEMKWSGSPLPQAAGSALTSPYCPFQDQDDPASCKSLSDNATSSLRIENNEPRVQVDFTVRTLSKGEGGSPWNTIISPQPHQIPYNLDVISAIEGKRLFDLLEDEQVSY